MLVFSSFKKKKVTFCVPKESTNLNVLLLNTLSLVYLILQSLSYLPKILTLNRQPHKMVKDIQIICRQPRNCLSVFDHFVRLALKGLNETMIMSPSKNYCEQSLWVKKRSLKRPTCKKAPCPLGWN